MRLKIICLLLLVLWNGSVHAADTLTVHPVSPVPVAKTQWTMSLSGVWLFNPAPERSFEKQTSWNTGWKKIQVPGEWEMQGFKVKKQAWAGYVSTWNIPETWSGKRIKFRCDGVYSEAEVYVNGQPAASHIGGFTPFETDITDLLKGGRQLILAIKVKNEGWADSTSAASSYAVHALGGITRKIQLIALPEVNIGSFQGTTLFDKNYQDARLNTELTLRNEGRQPANLAVLFELINPKANAVAFSRQVDIGRRAVGSSVTSAFQFSIAHPLKWDSEHPNLYVYRATLLVDGLVTEITEKKIGFRQIEVRGNRLFVNNTPVKLRGVCHHDVMPLRGRSVTAAQCLEDVKLFAAGNVNYIRTSHYPPPEELVDACDSVGMFLEVEAPFCWAERATVPAEFYKPVLQDQTLDMVDFFRSHPSVLMWSVGNESKKFAEYFKKTADLVKKLDPTRPRNFSQYEPNGDNGELEIGNHHYPGPDGPEKYRSSGRPIVFDEYCHLNAYNRFELVTDPGLRDAWGIGMSAMWEKMYATPAIMGGALWAGIDDTFVMNDTTAVGFGTWGVVDGWRRPKPEYWHMKKAYSPVKIKLAGNWTNGAVKLIIENRHIFSNLNECQLQWHLAADSGILHPDIAPGKTDTIKIACKRSLPNQSLHIKAYDARGILIDEYDFKTPVPEVGERTAKLSNIKSKKWRYKSSAQLLTASAGTIRILLDKNAYNLKVTVNDKTVVTGLPRLMILPLNPDGDGVQMRGKRLFFPPYNSTATNRVITQIKYKQSPDVFEIIVRDGYDEAVGSTVCRFNTNGKATIQYYYRLKKAINPRQWGVVINLAPGFNRMNWTREGLWDYYPADHIGRLKGSAVASSAHGFSGPAGPMRVPGEGWYHDQNALGTNDFRSTKMNIKQLTLSDSNITLSVVSDGSQHSRCWLGIDKTVNVLMAGYSNLGAEKFFNLHAVKFETPLQTGHIIQDTIVLNLGSKSSGY